jgi:hypothetical protein
MQYANDIDQLRRTGTGLLLLLLLIVFSGFK